MTRGRGDYIVYGLIDPRTLLVRYVGLSRNGLSRPNAHIKQCDKQRTNSARWIQGLKRRGLSYDVVVLERPTTEAALLESERWWIAYGRCLGWSLTNHTSGGEIGAKYDEASRRRMSKARKGVPHSAEHSKNIGRALRGKPKTASHKAQVCGDASPMKRPEVRAKQSASLRAAWADPTRNGKLRACSARFTSEQVSEANRRRWADPEYKARVSAAISRARRKRAPEPPVP